MAAPVASATITTVIAFFGLTAVGGRFGQLIADIPFTVIVVLLAFRGLRRGLLIGFVLFLTICGSFIFMSLQDVTLERISLGALIIALGMLVDNAIVIVDGMLVRFQQGMGRRKAALDVVSQTAWPSCTRVGCYSKGKPRPSCTIQDDSG